MLVTHSSGIFKLGEKGLSRDREAQPVRLAMRSTLTQARPNMKRLLCGRACYWDARHREAHRAGEQYSNSYLAGGGPNKSLRTLGRWRLGGNGLHVLCMTPPKGTLETGQQNVRPLFQRVGTQQLRPRSVSGSLFH